MFELGKVLPRIIHALASTPDEPMPFLFAKIDIKDGFWRMVLVPADDEFNFCYVMPTLPDAPTTEKMIVVPASLQTALFLRRIRNRSRRGPASPPSGDRQSAPA
jgi:hypothetical protein